MLFGLTLSVMLAPRHCYGQEKNPLIVMGGQKDRSFNTLYFSSWDFNVPLSHKDFVNGTSFLGARLGQRKKLNKLNRLWVGWEMSWAVYQQHYPFTSYQLGQYQAITAKISNYSYNYSITGNVDYFFAPMKKKVVPYLGLGVGLAYDKFAQYYSVFYCSWKSYGLFVKPEVGILVGFKENALWRIKAALHYDHASNYGISSDQYSFIPSNTANPNGEYRGIVNIGLQVGVVRMVW